MGSFVPEAGHSYLVTLYGPTAMTMFVVEPASAWLGEFFVSALSIPEGAFKRGAVVSRFTGPCAPGAVEHYLRAFSMQFNGIAIDPENAAWYIRKVDGVTKARGDMREVAMPDDVAALLADVLD